MAGRIDLHLHTHYSDGLHPPEHIVGLLADAGVTTAAITDHDTIEAWPEANAAAAERGIRLICATELSVYENGQDLHLLAYFLDPESKTLGNLLRGIRDSRLRRLGRIVDRLQLLGMPVDVERIRRRAEQGNVGRVHIARELAENGWVSSYLVAFRDYLGDGGPACVPKETVSLEESFKVILEAGGVPVLAHPGIYRLDGLLEVMVSLGLAGLEVHHPSHDPATVRKLQGLAERWGLEQTGGTDYHGGRDEEWMPGSMDLDEDIVVRLEARRP